MPGYCLRAEAGRNGIVCFHIVILLSCRARIVQGEKRKGQACPSSVHLLIGIWFFDASRKKSGSLPVSSPFPQPEQVTTLVDAEFAGVPPRKAVVVADSLARDRVEPLADLGVSVRIGQATRTVVVAGRQILQFVFVEKDGEEAVIDAIAYSDGYRTLIPILAGQRSGDCRTGFRF